MQRLDMDWGRQNPGHLAVMGGGEGLLPTFLVKQHLPLPGQSAFLSISSQRRAKNPVTQVP